MSTKTTWFGDIVAETPAIAPVVQAAFADRADLRLALAANPTLDPAVWDRLWAVTKKSADFATALVNRKLDPERVQRVLGSEKRVGVLTTLVRRNPPTTPDEIKNLLSMDLGQGFLLALFRVVADFPELSDLVGAKLEGLDHLEWLATTNSAIDLDATRAFVIDMPKWFGNNRAFKRRSNALKKLFDRHPAMLTAAFLTATSDAVHTAAAQSRHLTSESAQCALLGIDHETLGNHALGDQKLTASKYVQLALANNPYATEAILHTTEQRSDHYDVKHAVQYRRAQGRTTVTTPLECLEDQAQIAWVLTRSLPKSGRDFQRAARFFDLAAMAANPNLSEQEAAQVASALGDRDAVDTLNPDVLKSALSALGRSYLGLDPALVDVSWIDEYLAHRHDVSERWWRFTPTPEAVTHVAVQPTNQMIQQGHLLLSCGQVLVERLGDDPHAWMLFADLVNEQTPTPLGAFADSCRRLSAANRT